MNPNQVGPEPLGVVWRLARPALARANAPAPLSRFGWIESEQAGELARAIGGAALPVVASRLAAGRRCCAAWADGQLAAWGWVSFGTEHVGELGLQVRLRPDEAYIWDCATGPTFRRRGLYTALLAHMAHALLDEGMAVIWIGADYNNAPSQAGIRGAGFSAVADLVAAAPRAGEHRRRTWMVARPGIGPDLLADARRVYLDAREEVWLFDASG